MVEIRQLRQALERLTASWCVTAGRSTAGHRGHAPDMLRSSAQAMWRTDPDLPPPGHDPPNLSATLGYRSYVSSERLRSGGGKLIDMEVARIEP